MSMTKTDYEMVAETIKLKLDNFNAMYMVSQDDTVALKYFGAKHLAEDLADTFESDNNKFDRNKFLQACGIEQE